MVDREWPWNAYYEFVNVALDPNRIIIPRQYDATSPSEWGICLIKLGQEFNPGEREHNNIGEVSFGSDELLQSYPTDRSVQPD